MTNPSDLRPPPSICSVRIRTHQLVVRLKPKLVLPTGRPALDVSLEINASFGLKIRAQVREEEMYYSIIIEL